MFVLVDLRFSFPESEGEAAAIALDAAIGATVEPLDAGTARSLGLGRGEKGLVVTSLATGGPADRAGMESGDVIERVEGARIASAAEAAAALRRARDREASLMLNRRGNYVMVHVPTGQRPDRITGPATDQGGAR
jgi:serine protease Do